jgi:hypothetical protein
MRARCYDPSNPEYKNYGGRGIKICDEWLSDFNSFVKWALENGYNETLTLDRIDSSKDYEPNNCRWVSMKEQENNRRNNKLLNFNGVVMTQSEWCEVLEIPFHVLFNRLRRKWDIKRALTTPVRKYNKGEKIT